jgi:hypothetical protein
VSVRTGLGWDSHRLAAGRPLILGGVTFPDAELGLDGHSDADVLTHAVMDALLGAGPPPARAWASWGAGRAWPRSRWPRSSGLQPKSHLK